ncbi:MAG: NAD-dependent epimerase/dehydratase family protein [Acidobacteriota bacterium]
MRRRDFLTASLAAASGLLLPGRIRAGAGSIHRQAPRPLRILVLGGTNFVGPAIVRLALERGHEVTLFNRHHTNPWLFTHVERLVGDRYPNRGDGLRSLAGDRRWDAVVDTWQESPICVRETAKLLRERCGYYAYVSSIAVYQGRNYRRRALTEDMELPPATMPETTAADLPYPARKQLGERAVSEAFPERHGIFRAYAIVGTDGRGRLDYGGPRALKGCYWPIRLRAGGEVLAPGDGTDPTQWTDVRDLAEFIVHCLETETFGTFNVSTGASFRDFLHELSRLATADPTLTWVPAEFLFERNLASFTDVPGWVSHTEVESGFYRGSTERAREAGLRPRSIAQTFRPVVDTFLRDHGEYDFTEPGYGPAIARREGELLAAWRERVRAGEG